MLLLASVFSAAVYAEVTVYTNLGPGRPDAYGAEVIRLALDKTVPEYGDYILQSAPAMQEKRALKSIQDNIYSHPIRVFGATQASLNDTSTQYIPFPIFLGIYSYRVCWVTKPKALEFAASSDLDDLKNFTHGQLGHFRDVSILRHNGYRVVEGINLYSLYKMLGVGRVDLFCRGASEPFSEESFAQSVDNIVLDNDIAFYYSLPHFLFTSADDVETAQRLELGLIRAYQDGSLMALWNKSYSKNVQRAKLDMREVFVLENPGIQGIDSSYERFLYRPVSFRKLDHARP